MHETPGQAIAETIATIAAWPEPTGDVILRDRNAGLLWWREDEDTDDNRCWVSRNADGSGNAATWEDLCRRWGGVPDIFAPRADNGRGTPLPPEPPEGTIVLDSTDRIWRRNGGERRPDQPWQIEDGMMRGTWAEIATRWKPVRLVPEHAATLTPAEHRVMDLTAELVNLICGEVIGNGPSRGGDVREFVGHIHGIQRMVLAQAAARAYPGRYRLLGGTVAAQDTAGGEAPL